MGLILFISMVWPSNNLPFFSVTISITTNSLFQQAGQEYARRMELKELAAEKAGKEKQANADEKEKKE